MQDARDLVADPQFESRQYFVATKIERRSALMSGAPAKLTLTPWALHRPAPTLGQASSRSAPAGSNGPVPCQAEEIRAEAPLTGVRVLTFTQAWTGPLATELLGLLGADVVQIEARSRPDVRRTYSGGYAATLPEPIADPSRRQRAWNVMGLYNGTNLNKRAITLDMGHAKGVELFWKHLPRFDIFAENFSPRVLPNWRVTY